MEIPERPRKLSARVKQQILRLHDKPYTPAEISRELNIDVDVVREALVEMTAGLDRGAPWM